MVDTILSAMMIIIILRIEKAIQTTTSGIIQKHNLKNDRTTSKHRILDKYTAIKKNNI